MKTIFLLLVIVTTSISHGATATCDPVARARAEAALEVQRSDMFIPEDGEMPTVRSVQFLGMARGANTYMTMVYFGTEGQRKSSELTRAFYVITVNRDTCTVDKAEFITKK